MLTGSCLCGDIAFAVDGPLTGIAHCHCSMCRKFHGSAYATLATADPAHFRWVRGQDKVAHYRSSVQGHRHFCPRCGAAAPACPPGGPFALIPLGNIAEDPGMRPDLHFFAASQAPWHTIVDDLPRHSEYPVDWGGPPGIERAVRKPVTVGATAGSCLCGTVAYEFDGPIASMVNCHCSRCRRAMSAAYGTFVFVPATAFRWLMGTDRVRNYKMPDAEVKGTAFCRDCGSQVARARDPDTMQIPAGSLDTDPGVRPAMNIFTASKAPWSALDASLPGFAAAPGS